MQRRGKSERPAKRRRQSASKPKARKAPTARLSNANLQEQFDQCSRERDEALEQLTATSEVLQVISQSTFNLQSVLSTLVHAAGQLCQAENVQIFLRDGEVYRLAADNGFSPEYQQYVREHPIRPGRNTLVARTLLEGKTVHIRDSLTDPEYTFGGQKLGGYRTMLGVPLIRDENCIGVIALTRSKVHPFTDNQIKLVTNFAAQALVAIENTRLFNETRDALVRQNATAEILKIVASSPTDVEPVFKAIVRTIVRVMRCDRAFIMRCEGKSYYPVANALADGTFGSVDLTRAEPIDAAMNFPSRAIVARKTIYYPDRSQIELPEYERMISERYGVDSSLFLPLLRGEECIGLIALASRGKNTFGPSDISLAESFRDQAVIAIENARLFDEVQAKTTEIEESLQQQTATADVLKVISRSAFDLQAVLDTLIESAVTLSGGSLGAIFQRRGEHFHLTATHGYPPEMLAYGRANPIAPGLGSNVGRTAMTGTLVQIPDVTVDPDFTAYGYQRVGKYRAMLGIPLMRDGKVEGVFSLAKPEPGLFAQRQVELVQTFADQAAIAIENARLFNETQEALERQTATADILKVIAGSPDDVQPVFQIIAERSNELVSGLSTSVLRFEDGMLHMMAFTRVSPEADSALKIFYPKPLSAMPWGETARQGKVYITTDIESEDVTAEALQLARLRGWRSVLIVPLLSDRTPIGAISVTRREPGGFAEKHVQLLKTFADQAVIAISNVGLFNEVQQRTRELSRSLDDLRAAQDRLVQTEKLASLGQLTAGIAHEIKNPLNFVNNFSALSAELTGELNDLLKDAALSDKMRAEVEELTRLLQDNLEKVVQHGKRADAIVKNMLLHSREGSREQRPADVNTLVDESLNLAYHGARAEKSGFEITLQRDFDANAGAAELFPQEISRALLNLLSNGFYAATKRKAENGGAGAEPTVLATTKSLGSSVEIRIRDNGAGIPPEVREKMFNPFFTTKPAGEGTGLGLSMTHDIIVKQHGGRIDVETRLGEFTEFIIILPRNNRTVPG